MQHRERVVLRCCSVPTKVNRSRGYSAHPRKTSNTFEILSEAWRALESLVDREHCGQMQVCSAGIWSQESCVAMLVRNEPALVSLAERLSVLLQPWHPATTIHCFLFSSEDRHQGAPLCTEQQQEQAHVSRFHFSSGLCVWGHTSCHASLVSLWSVSACVAPLMYSGIFQGREVKHVSWQLLIPTHTLGTPSPQASPIFRSCFSEPQLSPRSNILDCCGTSWPQLVSRK